MYFDFSLPFFRSATAAPDANKYFCGSYNLATLLATLELGLPPLYEFDGKQQAMDGSHRCHNVCCVRSDHVVWETRDENSTRDHCRNGCFTHCPHTPKCIWQRHGIFLTCRNSPSTFTCLPGCILGCYSACNFTRLVSRYCKNYLQTEIIRFRA